ncbi:hypothetical protein PHMEG_00016883 [Phytophthora megakarya]|uniref:Uncharacterized protein n=1 Tax=Phytophthora megakarya TaxID=4795 RepID=A0A225VXN0_9STRA|nr:hypothetical protein PHMEG_00016883 [Phytophthora megakarya]
MPREPCKRPQFKRWDSDGVDAEAPTSIDIVLHWLCLPGNYQRWQSSSKLGLCTEIIACMKDKGITHRAAPAVWHKIHRLEKSFKTATSWLVAEKHFADFQKGTLSEDVKKKLEKQCPYYDELSVAFSRGLSSRSVRQGRCVDKKKVCKEQKTRDDDDTDEEVWSSQSPHLPLRQRDKASAACSTRTHTNDSHRQRLLEIELESKKAQFKAETVCSVALNRKKMLDAGISQEEVDRLLPQ